jgi:hypothetical protein
METPEAPYSSTMADDGRGGSKKRAAQLSEKGAKVAPAAPRRA